jgi:hypothetical protein
VVEEIGDSLTPTDQDKKEVQTFLKSCAKSPYDSSLIFVKKSKDDMSRFRKQFRLSEPKVGLIDFIKTSYASPNTALGNWVTSLTYPLPEFYADEIHLATMGLSGKEFWQRRSSFFSLFLFCCLLHFVLLRLKIGLFL